MLTNIYYSNKPLEQWINDNTGTEITETIQ